MTLLSFLENFVNFYRHLILSFVEKQIILPTNKKKTQTEIWTMGKICKKIRQTTDDIYVLRLSRIVDFYVKDIKKTLLHNLKSLYLTSLQPILLYLLRVDSLELTTKEFLKTLLYYP